jgi:hypothetical protein
MPLYPKDFIENTFLKEYKEIIYTHQYHYIGFVLVCIGVEFLGKCLNAGADWQKTGLSKKHFGDAIGALMPRYNKDAGLLYSALRSGLAHGLLPGPKIGLTHRAEAGQYGTKHLAKHQGALTLVIEDFYDDFEIACRNVIARTFAVADKMNRPLLSVPSDPTVQFSAVLNTRTTPY